MLARIELDVMKLVADIANIVLVYSIDIASLFLDFRYGLCVDCVIQMSFFLWVLLLGHQTSLLLLSFFQGIDMHSC